MSRLIQFQPISFDEIQESVSFEFNQAHVYKVFVISRVFAVFVYYVLCSIIIIITIYYI